MSTSSVLLSLVALLCSLSPAAAQTTNPSFVPSVTWTTAAPAILPRRTYPACAYNIHQPATNPIMFILGGELNYTNQVLENDIWYSTDGFYADSHQIQPTSLLNSPGTNFTHRRAGTAVYLNNGNLVWLGGKTDDPTNANGGQLNTVYYSTDQANTWSVATAPWTPRSDVAACVPPYTNTIWMAGGQINTGIGVVNETWVSTDGIGAVWTQAATVPYLAFQSATCAFYYDASISNNSYSATNPTLFMAVNNGTVASFLLSTDLGNTWGSGAVVAPWGAWNFMNVLIDPSNNLYVLGGQNSDVSSVWWSSNYGTTWYVLNAANSLNLADQATFYYATTSCAALTYYRNFSTTAGITYRTIALYGGSVWLSDNNISESIHGITTAPVLYNQNLPSIQWTTAGSAILPRRTYPACAYNVHANPTLPPAMFILGGELNYTNQVLENDIWYSTDGFYNDAHQIQPTSLINMPGVNFTHRRAGSAVYLANGNLVWFGGKTDDPSNASGGEINSVYWSTDQGYTWSASTAVWSPRSDISACTPPGTNTIYMAGGQQFNAATQGANVVNEVWLSTDGTGTTWTQQPTAPFIQFQSGACAFFYDSSIVNSSATTTTSTLFLLLNNGQFYTSTNLGTSYSQPSWGPWTVSAESRNFMNVLIDRSNYLYVFSGQNYLDNNIYFSTNYGSRWSVLPESNNLNLADGAYFSYATTSCAAMTRWYNVATGTFYKAIAIYGGSVWLSDNSIVEAIHAITSQQLPIPAQVPQISWQQASPNIMPRRTYQSCAVNIHTAPTQLPKMFMMGGEVNYTNQILTNDIWYSTDGFFSDSHQIQPTSLLNSGANFTHRRAGSAVYLANGNLLWFGGKDDDPSNSAGGQVNTVYYSTDEGNSWSVTTAQWSPRSDMAACVAPLTNTVFQSGGQEYNATSTGSNNVNEAWVSTDGIGATWTQVTSVPTIPFQSGVCSFFYDSNLVNSSSSTATATLMLLDDIGHIWFSTNYGQSYTGGQFGPWLVSGQQRNFMNLIMDRDNLVYVLGGQNYLDSSVYFSRDKGQSWNVLPATNLLNQADGASFYYATTSCAGFLNYQNNGQFYKSLTVFGGSVWLTDNNIVESIHGLTTLQSTVSSYSYTAYNSNGGSGSNNSGGGGGSGLSGGAIAGIVIGSVVGALILLGICVAICVFAGRGGEKKQRTQLEESQTGSRQGHAVEMQEA